MNSEVAGGARYRPTRRPEGRSPEGPSQVVQKAAKGAMSVEATLIDVKGGVLLFERVTEITTY